MFFKKALFCTSFFFILGIASIQCKDSNDWNYVPRAPQKTSLLFHSWSIYSQFGEEGVLDEILKKLQITDGTFIEFSVFYDTCTSNVRYLADREWQGIFVDASTELLRDTRKNNQYFRLLPSILCLEEILYFKDVAHLSRVQFIKDSAAINKTTLDRIGNSFFYNNEIDVLSIDLGGADLLLLERVQHKPKIIIVKAGCYWTPFATAKIPAEIALYGLNQPLAVVVDEARNQGYTPVCYTGNVFLVRDDLLKSFQEIKKDPVTLWRDAWYYYLENQPSYVTWIIDKRASHSYIQQFDPLNYN